MEQIANADSKRVPAIEAAVREVSIRLARFVFGAIGIRQRSGGTADA